MKKSKKLSDEHRNNISKAVKGKSKSGIKINVDGVDYKNIHEVSKKYNVHVTTVKNRCLSINYPNWFFINRLGEKVKTLDLVDSVRIRRLNNKPKFTSEQRKKGYLAVANSYYKLKKTIRVMINGVCYRSLSDAGKDHNLDSSTVKFRCQSENFYGWELIKEDKVNKFNY